MDMQIEKEANNTRSLAEGEREKKKIEGGESDILLPQGCWRGPLFGTLYAIGHEALRP